MQKIISSVTAFFSTAALVITYILGFGTFGVSPGYEITNQTRKTGIAALYAGQGLCFDGEYYYSSGSITALNITCLAKWDKNLKRVKTLNAAVPKEFKENYKSDHIGGIDCANGYVYAPVEADGYESNFILLYDCGTLRYTGIYYELTCDRLTDGIPWCAADEESGVLYTSQYNNASEILRYDLETMEFIGALKLSETVNRIQGGSVYDGMLYLSYDVSDSVDEQVLGVDLESGEVSLQFERNFCNYDNEAEDICVYPFEDGSLFHTIDYDKLLGVMFTDYAPAVSIK